MLTLALVELGVNLLLTFVSQKMLTRQVCIVINTPLPLPLPITTPPTEVNVPNTISTQQVRIGFKTTYWTLMSFQIYDTNRFVQVAPQSFLPLDESFYSKHISILSVEGSIFVPRQKARIPSMLEKFLDGRQTKAVGHVASRTHARTPAASAPV